MMTFKRAIDGLLTHKKEANGTERQPSVYPAKVNVQARFLGKAPAESAAGWRDCGDVTHEQAAKQLAEFFGRGGLIETRVEEYPATVFRIMVTRETRFIAKCFRGDDG